MANAGTHSFSIGSFTVTALSEGQTTKIYNADDIATRFPDATPQEVDTALESFGPEGVQAMNLLLVQSDEATLLLDTGMGPASQPDFGHLIPNMQALGLTPGDIDTVFITHFHGDHIYGLAKADGTPAFPNARIVTSQTEWDHWMGREDFQSKAMLEALAERFSFDAALPPGLSTVDLPGHTPGQRGLRIESQGATFTHLADALHHSAQLMYPHWGITFDTDRQQAVATRRRILEHYAETGEWVMFYHLPFPGIGRIARAGETFTFQAAQP